MQAACKANS